METHVSPLSTGKTIEEAKPLIAKIQMSIKDAGYRYRGWVEKQSYVQKDIDTAGNLEKIKGIWVPVWLFEVSAESAWYGEVSYTVNYVEYETECGPGVHDIRHVPVSKERTEYRPASGNHYNNYLVPVSASRVITQKEIEALKFKQLDLKSHDESYLEGWQVQATDLNNMEAKDICNRRIKEIETQACKSEVEIFKGCSTKVTYNTSNFALLPMYVLSYTHKDGFYRNLINGVTGEVIGDFPVNKAKKLLVTVISIIAAVIIFFLFIAIFMSR
jgi:hypothetical protein